MDGAQPTEELFGRAINEEAWARLRADADPAETSDVLLRYQSRLMETTGLHQVTVCEKSRRTGMTWAAASDAVLTASAERMAGGMDVLYMGYNLDMAREFIDTAAMWAEAMSEALSEAGVKAFLFDDDGQEIQAFRIVFVSGYEIVALSSKPRSLRGRQGYLILDEAAFHDNLQQVIDAAVPFLMWGGKILAISTHFGASNAFNTMIEDARAGRKPYAVMRVTLDDALRDGLFRRICDKQGKVWSASAEAKWRADLIAAAGDAADEEFFCIPSQSAGAYLPRALIEANMVPDIPVIRWKAPAGMVDWPEPMRVAEVRDFCERELKSHLARCDASRRSCFGQDFARDGDASVLNPVQITANLKRVSVFILEMRDVPFEAQKQILFYVVDRLPRFWHGALDATGNGAFLAEVARQKYGPSCISEIKLSSDWYLLNMPKWKAALEDTAFLVPRDDDVLGDYRAVRMDNGIAKVPANARTKGRDGFWRHGDTAIAGALAHYATNQDGGEVHITPLGLPRSSTAMGEAYGFGDAGAVHISDFLRM